MRELGNEGTGFFFVFFSAVSVAGGQVIDHLCGVENLNSAQGE